MTVEYQYIQVRSNKTTRYRMLDILNKLFGFPVLFVVNMIIYHILIILTTAYLKIELPSKVMVVLGAGDVQAVSNQMDAVQTNVAVFVNVLFLIIILILDLILLLILKKEFKFLKLTNKKIIFLELAIFTIGIFNPYVRTALFFFSVNTLQITVAYRFFIKKWVVFQYVFILGSYILIFEYIYHIIKYLVVV